MYGRSCRECNGRGLLFPPLSGQLNVQAVRTQSAPNQGREGRRMSNSKLQAAIDELERLYGTVKAFKARNGTLPNPDSDAGRAVLILESFAEELKKLQIGQLVYVTM